MKKKPGLRTDLFYKMLTEMENAIGDNSCGCMGYGYTLDKVIESDLYNYDGSKKDKPSHYLADILRKYIKTE